MSALQRQLGIGEPVFQAHEPAIQPVNRAIDQPGARELLQTTRYFAAFAAARFEKKKRPG